jgi:hypothetical protein
VGFFVVTTDSVMAMRAPENEAKASKLQYTDLSSNGSHSSGVAATARLSLAELVAV